MGIFSHNIYENIRTRTIVVYQGSMLLHPPQGDSEAWRLPGGGLEANESIAECAQREVFEETDIRVRVGKIAFLLEWVVPKYTQALEPGEGERYGYGLEVFHYAYPEEPVAQIRAEQAGDKPAQWIPLVEVPELPIWPKQIKELCRHLASGYVPEGCLSFLGQIENPLMRLSDDPFIDSTIEEK